MLAVKAPCSPRWIGASLLVFSLAAGTTALLFPVPIAHAKDVRISIPKRTKPTPIQKLNQEGVAALKKHDYKKARTLFYKAYLIDPNDPFTLNNLGYIAELDGQIDRAQRYYALAADHATEAVVEKSTATQAVGQPVDRVAGNAVDSQMQINRMNVQAIGLLQKDRAPEADLVLQKAWKLDPNNAFTLNNLGFAKEKEGELEEAYRYYTRAANLQSGEPIVVTARASWRGKRISDIAARNAENVRKLMEREQDISSQVARLNTRGVSAINRNDLKLARQYFQQSYKLDPANAFTLNNMGYLAEIDGDRETADFFYSKAKEAERSNSKVVYASRKDVEGMRIGAVASDTDDAVAKATEEAAEARRREGGPVVLLRRDNTPVAEPAAPPKPEPSEPVHVDPEEVPPEPAQPAPSTSAVSGVAQPSSNQPQGQTNPGIMMPLPDNQQPPAAKPGQQPQSNNAPQQQPANTNHGIMMPLPNDQQPPAAKQPPQ